MNKPKKNGFLWGVLGTFFVILGVVGYVIVSSLINRIFIGARFGDEIACAQLTLTGVGLVVAFLLYEAIFITWQLKLTRESSKEGDEGGKTGKLLRIVAASAISLSLLFAIVSANTFVELRPDSISNVFFFTTKEYKWENTDCDVRAYSFVCDEDGGLSFSVSMWDGKTFEILGSATSASDAFKNEFDTSNVDLLKYCANLSESFDNCDRDIDIQCNVSDTTINNARAVYENDESKALIWAQIERIILASQAN